MQLCNNCGEQIEDEQKICTHCGISLEFDKDKKVFIPIDYSDVREAIPEGEDIIYSSFCSAQKSGMNMRTQTFESETFQSHVLFTKNGIAYQEPEAGLMKSNYLPWYKVNNIATGSFMIQKGSGMTKKIVAYTMTPITKYESLKEFEMRSKRFYFDFVPHVLDEKKKHRSSEGLKKLQKSYNKLKKILGEEECEFFKTNVNYEEFQKHLPLLEKAMLESAPKWAQYLIKKQLNK
jgi:hypothetical protein